MANSSVESLFEHYLGIAKEPAAAATLVLAHAQLQAAPPPEGDMLTLGEVGRRLGVCRSTVKKLIEDGQLRTLKVNRRLKVKRAWLDDYEKAGAPKRTGGRHY